jgi:hypothetical protein
LPLELNALLFETSEGSSIHISSYECLICISSSGESKVEKERDETSGKKLGGGPWDAFAEKTPSPIGQPSFFL